MFTEYILGGSILHERLCAMTEILGKIVFNAPRPVNIEQLERLTGRTASELTKLCSIMGRAGLIFPEPDTCDSWSLVCEASMVTLEDVFRCVVTEKKVSSKSSTYSGNPAPGDASVDLLVTQAMLAVNQSVFKNLRQFSLDRLNVKATEVFPGTCQETEAVVSTDRVP